MKLGTRPSTGPGAFCRSCKAPIVWAFTDRGAKMPVDLNQSFDGNLVLWYEVDDKDRPVGHQRVSSRASLEHMLDLVHANARWLSHFATCPKASAYRKGQALRGEL